jgi:hypothetical protein
LSITGSTCFKPRNTPTTLTSITFRKVSSGYAPVTDLAVQANSIGHEPVHGNDARAACG